VVCLPVPISVISLRGLRRPGSSSPPQPRNPWFSSEAPPFCSEAVFFVSLFPPFSFPAVSSHPPVRARKYFFFPPTQLAFFFEGYLGCFSPPAFLVTWAPRRSKKKSFPSSNCPRYPLVFPSDCSFQKAFLQKGRIPFFFKPFLSNFRACRNSACQ